MRKYLERGARGLRAWRILAVSFSSSSSSSQKGKLTRDERTQRLRRPRNSREVFGAGHGQLVVPDRCDLCLRAAAWRRFEKRREDLTSYCFDHGCLQRVVLQHRVAILREREREREEKEREG
jgi:hypothetical protein